VKTLYFDCFSGISGDMTVGALLDLGVDFGYLKTEIGKLPLLNDSGFDADVMLGSSRVVRAQISAVKFDVAGMEDSNATHSHARGHEPSHSPAGDHGDSDPEGHSRDHSSDGPDDHGHVHRKSSEIIDMVKASGLGPNVRKRAISIFEKLAIAEGQVHDMPPEDVEFHEVGAIDSIIDVVGAAIGFDALEVNRFLCSSINIGGGFIHCQHGVYPVPAPATANLLTHAPVYSKHLDVELVTPTGAAILAATVDRYGPMDGFEIAGIGYGAGSKAFDAFPNCLRLFVGVEAPSAGRVPNEDIVAIEANIDDMSAEELAYAAERLLLMGALDVITMPVVMKKGRPGHLLQVLALPEHEELLSRTIFEETSSIGVRRRPMSRRVLDREMVTVETSHGKVGIKVARFEGRVANVSPEYEDCARLARKTGLPFHQIRDDAVKSYEAIPKNR
jgi:hypothetical protein